MKKGLTEFIVLHDNIMPIPGTEQKTCKTCADFLSSLQKATNKERQIKFTGAFLGGVKKRLVDDVPLSKVKLSPADFSATGTRDIFDSAANAIIEKGKAYSNKDESEHPENVIFTIVAFGRDNASKQFPYSQVADMVRHQSDVYKWRFFCVTSEAFVAEQLGIYGDDVILFDAKEDDYLADALDRLYDRVMNVIDPPPVVAEPEPEPAVDDTELKPAD